MPTDTLYRALIEQGPAVSYLELLDGDGTLAYISPQLKTLLGYHPNDWLTEPRRWRTRVHPDDRGRVIESFRAGRATGRVTLEYRYLAEDGRIVWVRDIAVLTSDPQGTPRGWHGILIDVTDRKQLEQELAGRAFHDPLTHLPNRALLLKRLEQGIERAQLLNTNLALFYLDLDNFKQVNDELGHALGDQLLVGVASRITACLRPSDTTSRVGGDEFIVLLEDIGSSAVAHHVAGRIIQAFAAPFLLEDHVVHMTASLGITVAIGADAGSLNDLLRKADAAMYDAKRTRKAQIARSNVEYV